MGTNVERRAAIKSADLRQAKLAELVLKSIGQDLAPLVSGSINTDDPLDSASWADDVSDDQRALIEQQLTAFRAVLRQHGLQAMVFIASASHLDALVERQAATGQ